MPDEFHAQLVEYLAATKGFLGHPTTGEPVVIVTVRPDPLTFRPLSIAITKAQAWRLARDLESLLVPFALLVALLSTTGCGARVTMESGRWGSSGGETATTRVEVEVLQAQRREQQAPFDGPKDGGRPLKIAPEPIQPVAKTQATEPPPKPAALESKPLNISGNTIVLNFRGGDTHYETHVHIHDAAPPRIEERATVRREVKVERRRVDARCERLAREHEHRVEMWKKFPFGN